MMQFRFQIGDIKLHSHVGKSIRFLFTHPDLYSVDVQFVILEFLDKRDDICELQRRKHRDILHFTHLTNYFFTLKKEKSIIIRKSTKENIFINKKENNLFEKFISISYFCLIFLLHLF